MRTKEVRHIPPNTPLSRAEQDDLFRQMQKWLDGENGIFRQRMFMLTEVENMYRMKATILQQRATIGGGDTAITQLEMASDAYRRERDAAHHVIIEAGIKPGIDFPCRCDECATVARGMERAGYLQHDETKWWDS
jgi:hypothetical protein